MRGGGDGLCAAPPAGVAGGPRGKGVALPRSVFCLPWAGTKVGVSGVAQFMESVAPIVLRFVSACRPRVWPMGRPCALVRVRLPVVVTVGAGGWRCRGVWRKGLAAFRPPGAAALLGGGGPPLAFGGGRGSVPPWPTCSIPRARGGWLGWVGSRPHPDLRDHGHPPSLRVTAGPVSRLSGLKVYRTDDRPRTPGWHTQEGDAAVPACVGRPCCLGKCVAWCSRPRWEGWRSLTLSPAGEVSAWTRHLQVYRHAAGRPLLPMAGGGHAPHTTGGGPRSLNSLARVVLL